MRGLIKQPPSSLAFSPAHPPLSPSSLQGISPPSSTLAVEGSSALAPAVCQLCHSPFHPRWASPLAPRIRARMRVNSPADTSTTLFSLLVNYMSLIVRYPLHRTATFSVLFFSPLLFFAFFRRMRSRMSPDSHDFSSERRRNLTVRNSRIKKRERGRDWKKNFSSCSFFA